MEGDEGVRITPVFQAILIYQVVGEAWNTRVLLRGDAIVEGVDLGVAGGGLEVRGKAREEVGVGAEEGEGVQRIREVEACRNRGLLCLARRRQRVGPLEILATPKVGVSQWVLTKVEL